MGKKYWIYEPKYGSLESAKDFDECAYSRYGADDALDEYLKNSDRNSNFVDGYPKGWEYVVVEAGTGIEKRFIVETEFEPSFYIQEKESSLQAG